MNRNVLLLFIAFLAFSATTSARQKTDCLAIYEASVVVANTGVGDSLLASARTDSSLDGKFNDAAIQDAVTELFQSLNQFSFKMELIVHSVSDSTVILFGQSSAGEQGISMKISTPDSLVNIGGRWMSVKNGKREWEESTTIEWRETAETRMIMGYRCQKFVQANTPAANAMVIWACPDLPPTLTPMSAYPLFRFAVLEVQNPQKGEHIILRRIRCAEKSSLSSQQI